MIDIALSDADYTRFRALIMTRTGLDFPPVRRGDLESDLRRTLLHIQDAIRYHFQPAQRLPSLHGLDDLYAVLVADHPTVWDITIDALTVCETHFFRTSHQFEGLRDHVLTPLVAARRRQNDLSLRLWSAGCASGEEAYSLAILLREMLPDLQAWRLEIIGTDLNQHALDQARQATYRDWSFREAYAQSRLGLYFDSTDAQHTLHADVRRMVRFEECNLVESCGTLFKDGRKADVILCRNVILYFGLDVRRWVYQRLYEALPPEGWLVVGHADPPPPNFMPFAARPFPGVTFFQRSSVLAATRPHLAVVTAPLSAEGPAEALERPIPLSELLPGLNDPLEPEPAAAPLTQEGSAEAEAHYRLGRWHADRQHWTEALHHCQTAARLDPSHAFAHYTLALIYQSMGNSEAAIGALRRTIYLTRNWPLPRFTAASIHRGAGEFDAARRELRNVITLTGKLPQDTPIEGGDGLTAARLRAAAERQLGDLNGLH